MDCEPHSMTSTTTHVALQVHRMGGSGDTSMAMTSAKEGEKQRMILCENDSSSQMEWHMRLQQEQCVRVDQFV